MGSNLLMDGFYLERHLLSQVPTISSRVDTIRHDFDKSVECSTLPLKNIFMARVVVGREQNSLMCDP